MQTTQKMTLAPVWPGKTRQSTLRRHVTMKALIAELTRRDMNHSAVASFLNCSCSTARSYMKKLLEAGVVKLPPRGGGRFVIDRANYAITSDAEAIADFLESQASAENSPMNHSKGFNGLLNGQRVHILSDDVKFPVHIDKPSARRDPLVSALFGRAEAGANRQG